MSYSQAKGRQWRWKLLELWRRFDRSFRRESTRRRFFFVMSFVSAIGLFAFLLYTVDYLNEASPRREYDDLQLQIRRKNIQTHIRERLSSASTAAAEKNCSSAFRAFDHEKYPECEEKLLWMRQFWKTDKCYAQHGVDGSDCSFLIFLSEIQSFCPVLSWRKPVQPDVIRMYQNQTDVNGLFQLLTDNPSNFEWIKGRLTRMWPTWMDATKRSMDKDPSLFKHQRLTIMLHLGFLSKETGLNFGKKSGKGGPLGELVQWTDLIASLHLLGHKLIISTETVTFRSLAAKIADDLNGCNSLGNSPVDLIFTDIMGLRMMRRKLKRFYSALSCRVRVLDSFGTHAEFNSNAYFTKHRSELGGKTSNTWGGHQLNLGQFLTMYPHTDDNTFLGFVVEIFDTATLAPVKRENISLVYAKENYMWEGADEALNVLREYTPIHGTVADGKAETLKKWNVVNHNLLSGSDFHSLLRKTKIFFGLGFPIEGPAPLEAIANGAVFINVEFVPPKSRRSYKFFADKPTLRELTSQNPYVERFIGEPHVYTVDLANTTSLRQALVAALRTPTEPYLPYEFTASGMLQRVHVLTSHQNFCTTKPTWPPFSSARVIHAPSGLSCQEACASEGLLCERTFFWRINRLKEVETFGHCDVEARNTTLTYAPTVCLLQENPLLYSCATKPPTLVRRICPCRTFEEGQSILCKGCS